MKYTYFRNLAFALFASLSLTACNGGINLTVSSSGNGSESSAIVIDDPAGTPTPSPTPNSTPSPTPSPSPSPTPTPTPTPTPNLNSRVFVTKAIMAVNKPNSRAKFEQICNNEAKASKINGKFTALVGMTTAVFGAQHKVEGKIYQVENGKEIPVADSFEDLINGKNNAIFTAACGRRLDETYYNLVWTGNNDFHKPSRDDMNCKNWGSGNAHGVVGWMGATGSDALSLRYLDCYAKARVYCIEVK